ncbi:gamma-tubulin complex component 2-like [Tubulanus polymorphus]|uniref:gamma-tubulin complex component 2-like n=1 Tax=Tubulanus polymorphus TaxID=672921 RepID=UPI003DA4D13A
MSVHEFKIQHCVSEIMNILGTQSQDGPSAELYAEMLMKNMTPYITTQVSSHNAKRKIAETSPTPMEFLQKYDELKMKNVRDLDPLVYLYSKLAEDESTKSFIEKNAKDRAAAAGVSLTSHANVISSLPAPGTKMSQQELSELRDKLLKEASTVSAHTPSDALHRVLRDRQANKNAQIPVQPDWVFQRPHLTMDFVTDDLEADPNVVPVGTLPTAMQEYAIIEDLLYCMQGIEGKYIVALPLAEKYGAREFQIDGTLDSSIRGLTERILPFCSDYSTVVRFIEEKSSFEYGLVNHALSAAMRTSIKDSALLEAQLEQQQILGQLTLQNMWAYMQSSMHTMETLASIANSINKGECIGGAVLSLLHEKTTSLYGDRKRQELCLYLTQVACAPYFDVLEKWIYKGIISDPYSEFLVEEDENFSKEKLQEDYNDAYWEQHYSICRERIPVFLEKVADKILSTGKYLNVVRQCGRHVHCPHAIEILYTMECQYVEQIEEAYSYASTILLELLMKEKELMSRLRSIKHYFLLDQGDFIGQFMDMAEGEMKKTIDEIMPTRLETLLELALRTSTANVDPFKDDLKVDLLPYDLITQLFKILTIDTKLEKDYRVDPTDLHLSGLEAFSFDYVVKWPVSLVLNKKALTRYQMLFRHLFYCKHVERQLCDVWISNKGAKQYTLHSSRWFASAFALRQRMLNFVQNFEYYMMFEVLEPNWVVFENNLSSVSNLDDVLAYHTDFLNVCLKDCMLTNPDLLKIVHKLMMVCVTFSNFIQRLSQATNVSKSENQAQSMAKKDRPEDKRKTTTKVVSEHVENITSSENFERTISNFDSNFNRLLVSLLEKIMDFSNASCEHKMINVLYRLDFSGYYSEQLEALSTEKSMIVDQGSVKSDSGSPSSRSTASAPASMERTNSAR